MQAAYDQIITEPLSAGSSISTVDSMFYTDTVGGGGPVVSSPAPTQSNSVDTLIYNNDGITKTEYQSPETNAVVLTIKDPIQELSGNPDIQTTNVNGTVYYMTSEPKIDTSEPVIKDQAPQTQTTGTQNTSVQTQQPTGDAKGKKWKKSYTWILVVTGIAAISYAVIKMRKQSK